jgi:hypothetical protein
MLPGMMSVMPPVTREVIPGSTTVTTVGASSFVVPEHDAMTITLYGAGGGGGSSSGYDGSAFLPGNPGGAAGNSTITGGGPTLQATGGQGGIGAYGNTPGPGTAGTGSGGTTNTFGGGRAGGTGGSFFGTGGAGGAGGFTQWVIPSGALVPGTVLTITLGAGGAGGATPSGGLPGNAGQSAQATISWS